MRLIIQFIILKLHFFTTFFGKSKGFLQLHNHLLRLLGVKIEGNVFIDRGIDIYSAKNLKIAEGTTIGRFSLIHAHSAVEISENCLIAAQLSLVAGTHDVSDLSFVDAPIYIGPNTWIGLRATFIGPTSIGKNSIVAAGSVVKGIFPPNAVIGGNPAKILYMKELK